MEANRQSALDLVEAAEKKLQAHDVAAAQRLLDKSHRLFPTDECAVLVAWLKNSGPGTAQAEIVKRILTSEALGHYAVMELLPTATPEEVAKKYKKLALQLHPDKNKAIGAKSCPLNPCRLHPLSLLRLFMVHLQVPRVHSSAFLQLTRC